MKYIRTKHTIFEVVDENEKVYLVCAKSDPTSIYSKSKCQTDIIKEGETIEELCDLFVVYEDLHRWEIKVSFAQMKKEYPYDEHYNMFGAIWTDKGLIYVAKMNEKGELELI